jgi:hypothetical protein
VPHFLKSKRWFGKRYPIAFADHVAAKTGAATRFDSDFAQI